ncbi:MAG TPA: malate dehydrogenase [Acidimicrobiales bacterium]|nr:malate dehydrogenase [Acidimicrobiales bacterium]
MPKNKDLKRLVRGRAARTGESYSTARAQVLTRRTTSSSRPVTVAVTGASGRVAYNLLFRLASGDVFGPDTPVNLRLVDVAEALPALEGVVFELDDCAFPLLTEVDVTSAWDAGFDDASWVLALGAPRRTAGMERRDLLEATAASFADQGRAIESSSAADVQVVVVGNPANTNCLVARTVAASVPAERWHAMLRLDHNRARSQVAAHAAVPLDDVRNIAIWGNHSPTMVPDAWHATIAGRPASEVLDEAWITRTLIPTVQNRGAELIEVSGASSAASAAAAISDTIRTIRHGTQGDEWTTDGTVSDGEYGVPRGLQFGFPVRINDRTASIAEDLEVSPTQRALLRATIDELVDEREVALRLIEPSSRR